MAKCKCASTAFDNEAWDGGYVTQTVYLVG